MFLLVSVAGWADLSFAWSEITETDFLPSQPNYEYRDVQVTKVTTHGDTKHNLTVIDQHDSREDRR